MQWSGIALGAEVPHRITRQQRPTKQIQGKCTRELQALVEECWHFNPTRRPAFSEIVRRVQEMRGEASGAAGAVLPRPRPEWFGLDGSFRGPQFRRRPRRPDGVPTTSCSATP